MVKGHQDRKQNQWQHTKLKKRHHDTEAWFVCVVSGRVLSDVKQPTMNNCKFSFIFQKTHIHKKRNHILMIFYVLKISFQAKNGMRVNRLIPPYNINVYTVCISPKKNVKTRKKTQLLVWHFRRLIALSHFTTNSKSR